MTPTETVRAFTDRWSQGIDELYQSLHEFFSPDAVWENVGLSKTRGPREAEEAFRMFEPMKDCQRLDVDYLHIMADGNHVMTERVDHVIDTNGNTTMSVRVMGIFTVENGKITEWRDYFDTIPFASSP